MKTGFAAFLLLALLILASCQPAPKPGEKIQLAKVEENFVSVIILLASKENDAILSAIFTPQESDLHLYSKDIPKTGIDGLGRPTLLEFSPDTRINVLSALEANVEPQESPTPPFELLIYPAGPVTLSLKIKLPEASIEEDIFITYMVCDEIGCRAPVQQKPVKIMIPARSNNTG